MLIKSRKAVLLSLTFAALNVTAAEDATQSITHVWNADISPVTNSVSGLGRTLSEKIETMDSNQATRHQNLLNGVESTNAGIKSVDEKMVTAIEKAVDIKNATDLVKLAVDEVNSAIDRVTVILNCTKKFFVDEIWLLGLTEEMTQDRLIHQAEDIVRENLERESLVLAGIGYSSDKDEFKFDFLQKGIGSVEKITEVVEALSGPSVAEMLEMKNKMTADSNMTDEEKERTEKMMNSLIVNKYISTSALAHMLGGYVEITPEKLEETLIPSGAEPGNNRALQKVIDDFFTPVSGCQTEIDPYSCIKMEGNRVADLVADDEFLKEALTSEPEVLPPITIEDFGGPQMCAIADYFLADMLPEQETQDGFGGTETELAPVSSLMLRKKTREMRRKASLINNDFGISAKLNRATFMINDVSELLEGLSQTITLSTLITLGNAQFMSQMMSKTLDELAKAKENQGGVLEDEEEDDGDGNVSAEEAYDDDDDDDNDDAF